MNKMQPGCVDEKKLQTKGKIMKVHKIQNCNYAVEVAKNLKMHIIGIGGVDVQDGNKKLILAIVW